jgi:predicted DNA binding CopG/RHH family protein
MILQDLSTLSSKDVIKQTIEQALDTVELTNARPVRVSVHQFLALKEQLAKKGITFQPSHTKQFII